MQQKLTIGVLSKQSAVKVETIRYYERNGLLPEPVRSAGGYRQYDATDVKRLQFIRHGRSLGFGLEEIRSLLQLADHPQQPCHSADELVQAHLMAVDAKIRDLQAIRKVLEQLAGCQSQTAAHCWLLETLEERVCCTGIGNAPKQGLQSAA